MVSSAVAQARAALLGEFRWHGGHADLSLALRSPELLSVVGAALAEPFRESHVDAVLGIEAQASTAARLVGRLGGTPVGTSVLVDGTSDAVREELQVVGLVAASELPPDSPGS